MSESETKIRFSLGHLYELSENGILGKDESGIQPKELIARTLSKKRKNLLYTVMEDLQMEVGNKVQNILNFDVYMDWSRGVVDDINLNGSSPEKLKDLTNSVERMGEAIYWATVQIPLFEECSRALLDRANKRKPLSRGRQNKLKRYIDEIHIWRLKADEIMAEKGEEYLSALEESRKELLTRGGVLPDVLDI